MGHGSNSSEDHADLLAKRSLGSEVATRNMSRDTLGGFPYEVEKRQDIVILRFFPRPTAKYPNEPVLTLRLGKEDKQKLLRILASE